MIVKTRYNSNWSRYFLGMSLHFLVLIFIFVKALFLIESKLHHYIEYGSDRIFVRAFKEYLKIIFFIVYPFFLFYLMTGYLFFFRSNSKKNKTELSKKSGITYFLEIGIMGIIPNFISSICSRKILDKFKRSKEMSFKRKMVFFYPFCYFIFFISSSFLWHDSKFVKSIYQFIGTKLKNLDILLFLYSFLFVSFYNILIWIKNKSLDGRRVAKIIFVFLNISLVLPAIVSLYYFFYFKKIFIANKIRNEIIVLFENAFPISTSIIIFTILFQLYLWLLHDKLADKLTNKLSYWQERKVKKLG